MALGGQMAGGQRKPQQLAGSRTAMESLGQAGMAPTTGHITPWHTPIGWHTGQQPPTGGTAVEPAAQAIIGQATLLQSTGQLSATVVDPASSTQTWQV